MSLLNFAANQAMIWAFFARQSYFRFVASNHLLEEFARARVLRIAENLLG